MKVAAASYVYYARRGDLIKIGWSCDPADRLRHLGAQMIGVERGALGPYAGSAL